MEQNKTNGHCRLAVVFLYFYSYDDFVVVFFRHCNSLQPFSISCKLTKVKADCRMHSKTVNPIDLFIFTFSSTPLSYGGSRIIKAYERKKKVFFREHQLNFGDIIDCSRMCGVWLFNHTHTQGGQRNSLFLLGAFFFWYTVENHEKAWNFRSKKISSCLKFARINCCFYSIYPTLKMCVYVFLFSKLDQCALYMWSRMSYRVLA